MKEKSNVKINLIIIFVIVSLILNIINGFFIYKLYNKTDKPSETTKEETEPNDKTSYTFKLDSENKYVITTDLRWTTMQNDGGSHTSEYYQIDLENNIISKVQEDYHANLAGTPSEITTIIYVKKIDSNIREEAKSLITEILSKEDINDSKNYDFFTISSLNNEKDIYSKNTIESINKFLKKIDELN